MKASEMIKELTDLMEDHGDLDVAITDGYRGNCYCGNDENDYDIIFFSHNNKEYIDIGIGGCDE